MDNQVRISIAHLGPVHFNCVLNTADETAESVDSYSECLSAMPFSREGRGFTESEISVGIPNALPIAVCLNCAQMCGRIASGQYPWLHRFSPRAFVGSSSACGSRAASGSAQLSGLLPGLLKHALGFQQCIPERLQMAASTTTATPNLYTETPSVEPANAQERLTRSTA